MLDVTRRLGPPELPATLRRLGLRTDDRDDAVAAAAALLSTGHEAVLEPMIERLRQGVGDIEGRSDLDPWADAGAGPEAGSYGPGVLPLLALVATAEDVVAWHARRGVPAEISWASLADLGHQAWVHRATYGGFGLHTQGWLRLVWSGAFLWLGRLQFNLQREPVDSDGGWVLSTHIPPSGPLRPQEVDDAFTAAATIFPRHFPDFPVSRFHCASWLLDPDLMAALPPESNMARFGRRWTLYGGEQPGDEDALFFTFRRRGEVDLDTLPTDTTLQRVIVDRLRTGGHWHVRHGHHPLPRGSA